jgi:hypothetical protein
MGSNNLYKNGIPQFDEHEYAFWRIRMKTYIQAHGFEIWKSIVYGYIVLAVLPTNDKVVKLSQNNSNARNELLNGIGETIHQSCTL